MHPKRLTRAFLESAYATYNEPRFIHPDPIEFTHRCAAPDREVVAFLAAALAYGRVHQILKSVDDALFRLGPPRDAVTTASLRTLTRRFQGFRHRFTPGDQLARLLHGAGGVIRAHGSLGACFASHLSPGDASVVPALARFVSEVSLAAGGELAFLLPSPVYGSACKRLNLFLRWMVRRDRVDPGGWTGVSTSLLVVPLDTHMHQVGLAFGLTQRKSGDIKTALEITGGFREFSPTDPVKFDFALTRMAILRRDAMAERIS